MAETWFDPDGLLRKYGTTKTVPDTAGEFKTYGALREIEIKIDLTTLTSSAVIQSDVVNFPKGVFVEEVVMEVQTAAATGTTFSVGLVQSNDRTTSIADDAFIAAEVTASADTAGKKITYISGTTKAGSKIGFVPIAASAAFTGLITAKQTGSTYTTGVIYVRIRYRKP